MGKNNWNDQLGEIGKQLEQADTQKDDRKNVKIAWALLLLTFMIMLVLDVEVDGGAIFFSPLFAGVAFHVIAFYAAESAPKLIGVGVIALIVLRLLIGLIVLGPYLLTVAIILVGGAIYFGLGWLLGIGVLILLTMFQQKK